MTNSEEATGEREARRGVLKSCSPHVLQDICRPPMWWAPRALMLINARN